MCGIFGTYNIKLQKEIMIAYMNRMSHRGPDGEGVWEDSLVQLGHRRLAILGLGIEGSQPMEYAAGRYIITYNGEIYNYIELRNELKKYGYYFTTKTDTEVILAAFEKWGEKCLNKFNGMFAFAIWDTIEKRLFIARDRFGVKPLYYITLETEKGHAFAFASEMKALMPLLLDSSYNIEFIINKNMLLNYEYKNQCIINNIQKFPAGNYGWIENGTIIIKRWWNTLEELIEVSPNYQEQVEMFRELFISSCALRMRSDVPLGTALSGGIDSSAVISTMANIAKGEKNINYMENCQHGYVATFPGMSIDEEKYAKIVAEYLDINVNYIRIDASKFIENISNDMWLFEDVYLTVPYPMMRLYEEMRKEGVKVTLDGHGADELFCGYDMDIKSAFYDAGFNLFKVKQIAETYEGLFSERNQNLDVVSNSWFSYYKSAFIDMILKRDDMNGDEKQNAAMRKMGALNRKLYLETHESTLPTLLRNYDKYSMASGVEIRMPFLDYRIVQFAFSIGWESKLRNGYTKAVIRDAMKGIMPDAIVKRKPKVGFSSPLLEWFKGPLKEFIEDTMSSLDFINCEMINCKDVKASYMYLISSENATQWDAEDLWIRIQPFFWKKFFYERAINNG